MRVQRITSEEAHNLLQELLDSGLYQTQYDIAKTIGVQYTTVNVWYKKHRGICNDEQADRLRKCVDAMRRGERMDPIPPKEIKLGISGVLYGAICSYISDCPYIPNSVKGRVLAEVNDVLKKAIHNMPNKWQNKLK